MAKESPNTKPKTETPFRKFEELAKRIVAVPKNGANGLRRRQDHRKGVP